MGTHLRVLSESFPMNTNMTGFGSLRHCALDKGSLGIGRVNAHSAQKQTDNFDEIF